MGLLLLGALLIWLARSLSRQRREAHLATRERSDPATHASQRKLAEGSSSSSTIDEAVEAAEARPPADEPAVDPAESWRPLVLVEGADHLDTAAAERPAPEPATWARKICTGRNGFRGRLRAGDRFGWSAVEIGDLDGDGIGELAVGAPGDDEGWEDAGAVWILFLDEGSRVREQSKIRVRDPALPTLILDGTAFGHALTSVPDLDGDGRRELIVAQSRTTTVEDEPGVMAWILFLDERGRILSTRALDLRDISMSPHPLRCERLSLASPHLNEQVSSPLLLIGFPDAIWDPIRGHSGFGHEVRLGAGGAPRTMSGNPPLGRRFGKVAEYGRAVLYTMVDGLDRLEPFFGCRIGGTGAVVRHSSTRPATSDRTQFIRPAPDGGHADPGFGTSLADLGERGHDTSLFLAVGLREGRQPDAARGGGVWILHVVSADLRIRRIYEIAYRRGGFRGRLSRGDRFGAALATLADRNEDGLVDLAVGASGDDQSGEDAGAIWLLGLNRRGTLE